MRLFTHGMPAGTDAVRRVGFILFSDDGIRHRHKDTAKRVFVFLEIEVVD
jgi:hypothetical protein